MEIKVTASEWYVLECLWEQAPKTLMQLVEELNSRRGWAKSTCTTTVKRMDEKGLIRHEMEGRTKLFFPMVEQEDATKRETRDFLQRIYRGSVGMLLNTLAETQDLTDKDLDDLQTFLDSCKKKREKGE